MGKPWWGVVQDRAELGLCLVHRLRCDASSRRLEPFFDELPEWLVR
jgi:hypothetical protein